MAGDKELTVDLSSKAALCFDVSYVRGGPITLDDWDFYEAFGEMEGYIKPVFAGVFEATFKGNPPFTAELLQINSFTREPELPLTIRVRFGFNWGKDQHIYEHSIDKLVAIEFSMHSIPGTDTYSMRPQLIGRFNKLRDALRELADKIDVELVKVVEDDDDYTDFEEED